MTNPIEVMAKAVRKEFIDHIVDHANPHWGAQKPDHLRDALLKAGYPNPDEAADFFANAASRAALLALSDCDLPEEVTRGNPVVAEGFRAVLKRIVEVSNGT